MSPEPGWRAAWLLAVLLSIPGCGREPADAPQPAADVLHELAEPLLGSWRGDLDGMLERRLVRALVPYSRTFYFLDERGSQRGLSHAFMEAFEDFLNARMDTGLLRVQVVYVPVTRDRLVPWLLAGRGDVIAANLTVTESRGETLLFTAPLASNVREVLVSGPSAAPIERLEDLSGRTVFVRRASSFFESLESLNREFAARRLPPVRLEEAPPHFEVGDVLELVNDGVVEHAVADDYLAAFWSRVLPDITVHETLALREGADIAFAVRPDSPALKSLLDEFLATHRAGTLFGNVTFERFLQDTRWVLAQDRGETLTRFERMARYFQRYGEQYELDWLLLIAQGYQESRLDQSARSPAGAIGVMQVLPSTGREMDVGDITVLENNIHAGARYVRWMIDRYYADEPMDDTERLLFALASYNAGPRRVQALRREAQALGLDPNTWFDNVEYVAAQRIGRETVEYVANIYKYHIAFRLIAGTRELAPLPGPG